MIPNLQLTLALGHMRYCNEKTAFLCVRWKRLHVLIFAICISVKRAIVFFFLGIYVKVYELNLRNFNIVFGLISFYILNLILTHMCIPHLVACYVNFSFFFNIL